MCLSIGMDLVGNLWKGGENHKILGICVGGIFLLWPVLVFWS